MNRQEFIDRLRAALAGEVPSSVIQSNVQYYQEYILDELRKGRSEEEILTELGSPRLIARTIIDSEEAVEGQQRETYTYREAPENRYAYESDSVSEGEESFFGTLWMRYKSTVILIAVIVLVLVVLSGLFSIALRILVSPAFWVILAAFAIVRISKNRR